MSKEPYYLYGAESSYYTGKIRSYLRKRAIPFIERNPSHAHFAEHVIPQAGVMRLPTLEAPDGTVVQDSTDIIDYLEKRHDGQPAYPQTSRQKWASLVLELYGDEGMLKPAMHYRWSYLNSHHNPFIFREFGFAMLPQCSMEEADAAGRDFAGEMEAHLPPIGVTSDSIPLIESGYEKLLGLLNEHFRHYPYVLGGRPTLGDYGLLGPLYAHLGRDPFPLALMMRKAPYVRHWVERMNVADDGMASFADMPREILAEDDIPKTLISILRFIVEEYFPEVISIAEIVNNRVRADIGLKSGDPVVPTGKPELGQGLGQSLGTHTVNYHGLELEQGARVYQMYMFQRPLEFYQSLEGEAKNILHDFVRDIGASDAMQVKPLRRIVRKEGLEVFE